MNRMKFEEQKRSLTEQELSNEKHAYCVEDERFLYYCRNGKTLHIAKGEVDISMSIEEWKDFAMTMLKVSDDYFVTGEGKSMTDSFLGWLLSKYTRRKEFAGGLLEILEDASTWAYGQ